MRLSVLTIYPYCVNISCIAKTLKKDSVSFMTVNKNIKLNSLHIVPAHKVIFIHILVEHLQDQLLSRQLGHNHLEFENKAFQKCSDISNLII